ncbi:MAG: 2-oxoacid:acceptor oxidoreductase subunit alpha [Anaerolineaceae bacterium]|nr:2-oxoacid:acceptor oxidoreductase subunit alpha [Anaerolineaceae bacterium]
MSMQEYGETLMSATCEECINNFSITFSTINGSGSATANTTILKSLFKMGIPVSGRNIFPSNIKGLATWYTIRLNESGYLGRTENSEIVVVMNPSTLKEDLRTMPSGGVLFYEEQFSANIDRDDIIAYPMPAKKIIKDFGITPTMREYVKNMVYVGVIAAMIDIDLDMIHAALNDHFKDRSDVVASNYSVITTAFDWAKENLKKKDPYRVEKRDFTKDKILTDGNTAAAIGSIFGGVQFTAWYPITPASSLPEALHEYLPLLRKNEDGKATFAIVQAEDELASIGMSIGAGWAGLRAVTATSGPGICLMSEYLGLAYFAEVPVVVWNVQRVGPSTGLPTRTAQCDITFCYFLSHGDTRFVMLFPSSINECFEFGWKSFDVAEKLQTPVQILSDLDLGMNQWMGDDFDYPDQAMDRGKVLWEDELDKFIVNHEKWGRYRDVDNDGISYRTCMGNQNLKSAYFSRGTGHTVDGTYSERPDTYEETIKRLNRKFESAREYVPKSIIKQVENAKIGIIAYGSTNLAVLEAQDILTKKGLAVDYLRIRALPYQDEVRKFIENHERCYVVELNDQGQMRQILTVELQDLATKLKSAAHINGLPITAEWIVNKISAMEGEL